MLVEIETALKIVPIVEAALSSLKCMYSQHVDNDNEIKELQLFIQDYEGHIPAIEKRFRQGGGNNMDTLVLNHLQRDLIEAAEKLQKWSTDKMFFRIFNSGERMKRLEKLHTKVMASVQRSLGIASISTLLDVRDIQTTLFESHEELKALLTRCIRGMPGTALGGVRAEVEEASRMSFADEKFWGEVLAAVEQREAEAKNHLYMDPILCKPMIDPIVASNGHTYCRWTIIDNNVKKDPYNPNEDLTILVDNLNIRTKLFEEFPSHLREFQERRKQFRHKALALVEKKLFADAAVGLRYVLQWDKSDEECVQALLHVEEALESARAQYAQSSKLKPDQGLLKGKRAADPRVLKDPRDQPASSNRSDRRETELRVFKATSIFDRGPCEIALVEAVSGVKSAVNDFANRLISSMTIHGEESKHLKRTMCSGVQAEVDSDMHWAFMALICECLFIDFEVSEFGLIGIPNEIILKKFCFKKFKLITGDSSTKQPFPIYQEHWNIIAGGQHPKSELYQKFLKAAVSVWFLNKLVHSYVGGWKMLGWKTYPKGSKFQKESMESAVPGAYGENTEANLVVDFLVIPGFQVKEKILVKSEVVPMQKV